MLSLHFNKQVFINALKANKNFVTYVSTTLALMLTLLLQCSIQGNLKAEFFGYAVIVSLAFWVWAIVDHKFRPSETSKLERD
ncbi:hypothetical protein [Acinetobacter stercoris]|uniref:Uncharacterized protein n=1 Tax=Acinetobacter stercoris TaxID=2126983 RepID=A0A2U3N439_9GAMM|nr:MULTISPECIES: hypothetical protein [Acinetobacter]SPL72403.1 hypothetical protein KPC_3581 [Acinetobacter stercoris]